MLKTMATIISVIILIPFVYLGLLSINNQFPGLLPNTPLGGTWTFIVPSHYAGPLVIRFKCPGGHPLVRNWHVVTIFSPQGSDCVTDDFAGFQGQYVARYANGAVIATDLEHLPSGGPALIGGGVTTIGGGTLELPGNSNFIFSAYYTGPVACVLRKENGSTLPLWCHNHDPNVFAGHVFGYTFCPDRDVDTRRACLNALEHTRPHARY